jgi:hypothetical protein
MLNAARNDDGRPDEELLAAYRREVDDDGRAVNTIYTRYQARVRAWMEAEGVNHPSEQQMGDVFLRAMNSGDSEATLADLLAAEARAVAQG